MGFEEDVDRLAGAMRARDLPPTAPEDWDRSPSWLPEVADQLRGRSTPMQPLYQALPVVTSRGGKMERYGHVRVDDGWSILVEYWDDGRYQRPFVCTPTRVWAAAGTETNRKIRTRAGSIHSPKPGPTRHFVGLPKGETQLVRDTDPFLTTPHRADEPHPALLLLAALRAGRELRRDGTKYAINGDPMTR